MQHEKNIEEAQFQINQTGDTHEEMSASNRIILNLAGLDLTSDDL